MDKLQTYLVNGFLDAGKTTYLNKVISRDFFYKRGKTLILSFEEGEVEYDRQLYAEKNTVLELYDEREDLRGYCLEMLEKHQPDRVYIETNSMMDALWEILPDLFHVVFSVTLMDGNTLNLYYNNMRGHMQRMVRMSNMVIFTQAEKEKVEAMGTAMKLMNNKCDYLWQSPLGYSERAFGVTLPFAFNEDHYEITDAIYANWYLDVLEHPEHYDGKHMTMEGQIVKEDGEPLRYKVGRRVMTCCIADISFLAVEVLAEERFTNLYQENHLADHAWVRVSVVGEVLRDAHGLAHLGLRVQHLQVIAPKAHPVIGL